MKKNCWEVTNCGRQQGGPKSAELGVCRVSVDPELSGAHDGKNAGRACWVVAGSLCGGKVQGTYAEKLHNCWKCEFMNIVKREEEPTAFGFSATRLGLERTLQRKRLG
jgi:hypothetical protein